jgi:Protein of unknown function (DUF3047)
MTAFIRTSDELRRYAETDVLEPITEEEFRERFSELLERAPQGLIRNYAFFSLPARLSTWLDTGIELGAGEAVTLFTAVRTSPPPEADAATSPELSLWQCVSLDALARRGVWHRVGADGEPLLGPRSSHTVVAPRSGRLFLASRPISESRPEDDPLADVQPPSIDRCALAVRWTGDALEGLETLRAAGDVSGLVSSELARQQAVIELPEGWQYPPQGGPMEQFAADLGRSTGPVIGCYSRCNGALLHKDAVLAFRPGTKLRWAWKIDRLPSRVREDRLQTHDYLSVAVEFDNGRDLTYYWSAELPVESGYHCPVPGWENRETHVVVRSGTEGLGHWFDEERDLFADYTRYVGEPPSGIVRVWLLAVTFFQRGDGQCEYGRIEFESGSTRLRVN